MPNERKRQPRSFPVPGMPDTLPVEGGMHVPPPQPLMPMRPAGSVERRGFEEGIGGFVRRQEPSQEPGGLGGPGMDAANPWAQRPMQPMRPEQLNAPGPSAEPDFAKLMEKLKMEMGGR